MPKSEMSETKSSGSSMRVTEAQIDRFLEVYDHEPNYWIDCDKLRLALTAALTGRDVEPGTSCPCGSALGTVVRDYVAESVRDTNALGEILRAWAFPGKGLGCYSTFELRHGFEKAAVTPREFGILWQRPFSPDDTVPCEWTEYCDAEAIKAISWFKHPSGIEVGWYWDGDGTLGFVVPAKPDPLVLTNSDCKHDDEWEFGALHPQANFVGCSPTPHKE